MRATSRSGLTLVELVVVTVVIALLIAVQLSSMSRAVTQANMTAVGVRCRAIYVAITVANGERKALGLQPLWPRDFNPAVDTNREDLAQLDFTTSTDYFKWLIDEECRNTSNWCPRVEGFYYSNLAGAGVPACSDNQMLTAKNNIWTVVKNVRDDMDDTIPVLVTRNVDASSLAAKVGEKDFKTKSLRFDPAWRTPFSNIGYVLARKSGAICKDSYKYMSYKVAYARQAFDTTLTPAGCAAPPLKYLTPVPEVTPNDAANAEYAARVHWLAGSWWGQVKRDTIEFIDGVAFFAFFFATVYLLIVAHNVTRRKRCGLRPVTSAPIIGVWICHGFAVTFYATFLILPLIRVGFEKPWRYGIAALIAQAVGISLALVFQRHDPAARRRQIKWLLAPLWIVIACWAVLTCLMVGPCG